MRDKWADIPVRQTKAMHAYRAVLPAICTFHKEKGFIPEQAKSKLGDFVDCYGHFEAPSYIKVNKKRWCLYEANHKACLNRRSQFIGCENVAGEKSEKEVKRGSLF